MNIFSLSNESLRIVLGWSNFPSVASVCLSIFSKAMKLQKSRTCYFWKIYQYKVVKIKYFSLILYFYMSSSLKLYYILNITGDKFERNLIKMDKQVAQKVPIKRQRKYVYITISIQSLVLNFFVIF